MNDVEIATVIVGITEVVKKIGLPSQYCPAFSIVLGAVVTLLDGYQNGETDIYASLIRGVIIGTTSTGIYATADKMIDKTTTQNANISQETH